MKLKSTNTKELITATHGLSRRISESLDKLEGKMAQAFASLPMDKKLDHYEVLIGVCSDKYQSISNTVTEIHENGRRKNGKT